MEESVLIKVEPRLVAGVFVWTVVEVLFDKKGIKFQESSGEYYRLAKCFENFFY